MIKAELRVGFLLGSGFGPEDGGERWLTFNTLQAVT
jgi:hypothetical protein